MLHLLRVRVCTLSAISLSDAVHHLTLYVMSSCPPPHICHPEVLRHYGPDLELALNESRARLEAFPRERLEHDDEAMRALDSGLRCPLLLRPWSLPPSAVRAPGARRMTQGQEATLGCVCNVCDVCDGGGVKFKLKFKCIYRSSRPVF